MFGTIFPTLRLGVLDELAKFLGQRAGRLAVGAHAHHFRPLCQRPSKPVQAIRELEGRSAVELVPAEVGHAEACDVRQQEVLNCRKELN